MIEVVAGGRLGNVLFQYAAGRHLAQKCGTSLKINLVNHLALRDPRAARIMESLRLMRLKASFTRPWMYRLGKYLDPELGQRGANVYREKQFGFDPLLLEQADGTRVIGMCQSDAYFRPITAGIREDLRIEIPAGCHQAELVAGMINREESVAIHVRRGDYLSSPLHQVCTHDYYRKAIRHMRQQLHAPRFFVFSDDIKWCEENFSGPDFHLIKIPQTNQSPAIEMELMKRCHHQIIANSTFSWWPAWLNENKDKIVLMPYRWFNQENLNRRAMRWLVPEEWVRIEF